MYYFLPETQPFKVAGKVARYWHLFPGIFCDKT